MIRSLCLFCGSRPGTNPNHGAAARELGEKLAEQGITLVYGGGHVGLMGMAADAALSKGGQVVGVIPQGLVDAEAAHQGLTTLHVTKTMHERKAMMENLSDAFVAMPGGFGTLDELCEIITWAQLKIHSKPIFLMNVNGYFDAFHEFLQHSVRDGFIGRDCMRLFSIIQSPDELLQRLKSL
ncbi:MAG: TIGR00730 family Rossman fold protein [Bdellovibrionaceae bacterium]|nr:TIGR00730 family Rossman fold protein [Pseudobdellovibrionaceae bacterium]